MRVFFDTSVLVAAMIEGHPKHETAFHWLSRAHRGVLEMVVTTHSLAELYAILTRLPIRPRLASSMVRRILRDNIEAKAQVLAISAEQFVTVLDELAERDLTGGSIYDALAVSVVKKEGINMLLTLHRPDFLRLWPEGETKIREP